MKTVLICIAIIGCFISCSNSKTEKLASPLKNDSLSLVAEKYDSLNQYYECGIEEFIKGMREKRQATFDTLFLGKHEEFPDIKLPAKIENTSVVVLTTEEANIKFAYRKSMTFVNMVDLGDKGRNEFMFITFYVDKEKEKVKYWPQHNCNINLKYNKEKKEFGLEEVKFDFPYPSNGLKIGI